MFDGIKTLFMKYRIWLAALFFIIVVFISALGIITSIFAVIFFVLAVFFFIAASQPHYTEIVAEAEELSEQKPGEHLKGHMKPPREFTGYDTTFTPGGMQVLSAESAAKLKTEIRNYDILYPIYVSLFIFLVLSLLFYNINQWDIITSAAGALIFGFFYVPFCFLLVPAMGGDKKRRILKMNKFLLDYYEPVFSKISKKIKATKTGKNGEIEFILSDYPKIVFRTKVYEIFKTALRGFYRKTEKYQLFKAAAPVSRAPSTAEITDFMNRNLSDVRKAHSGYPLSIVKSPRTKKPVMLFNVLVEPDKTGSTVLKLIESTKKLYDMLN